MKLHACYMASLKLRLQSKKGDVMTPNVLEMHYFFHTFPNQGVGVSSSMHSSVNGTGHSK